MYKFSTVLQLVIKKEKSKLLILDRTFLVGLYKDPNPENPKMTQQMFTIFFWIKIIW